MLNKNLLNEIEQKAINEFTTEIRNYLGDNIVSIKLFGSKARGNSEPDSDIDIYVLVNKISLEQREHIFDITFQINLKYDVYISPRVVCMETYKNPVFRLTPFIQSIEREGIPL
jgi:predicted nucleotidyltransferase